MNKRTMKLLWSAVMIAVALSAPGCGMHAGPMADPPQIHRKAPGYTYVLGAFTAYDMETPPYIPEKIRFELEIDLREKGILAVSDSGQNRLRADVRSRAVYPSGMMNPGGATSELYNELVSRVEVVDLRTDEVIAMARLNAFNGYGKTTSDFTEQMHAKDIADFLASIVR